MQTQARYLLTGQTAETHVLNDGGIDTSAISCEKQLSGALQLVCEHQNVEGQKSLHTALVQPIHQLGKVAEPKILSTLPGIEGINTEINGISTGSHGCFKGRPITRRGQQLRRCHKSRFENRRAASNSLKASAVPSYRQCQGSYITPC